MRNFKIKQKHILAGVVLAVAIVYAKGPHWKIKETLITRDLKPTLNDNVSSEKLYLFNFACFLIHIFPASVTCLMFLNIY